MSSSNILRFFLFCAMLFTYIQSPSNTHLHTHTYKRTQSTFFRYYCFWSQSTVKSGDRKSDTITLLLLTIVRVSNNTQII
uniref:Putative secreted protein n=1 Tax=Panstrongylus lignarius TaxID=156445 RepID=A0A224XSY2_9HEMI